MLMNEVASFPAGYAPARYQKERKQNRFDLRFPVRLRFSANDGIHQLETISKNVSTCSALLLASHAVPVHTPVSLTMTVEGELAIRPIQLSGEGEVVRVEPLQSGAGFAIAVACERPIAEAEMESDLRS